jgi:aerobic-type carbon monoxide dehydrogenase small subunit (CoxS/CutS family)
VALITLDVNGRGRQVEAGPDDLLLDILRDKLGLTGTKYGCGEAQCGACTVLVDGRARLACVTTLAAVRGRRVTTIEGLAPDGRLHPVQQAFLDVQAFQCGYCTPGMIVGAVSLLRVTPAPSEQQVRQALDGHVCRCGTYPRIVEAVRLAARGGGRGGNV